VPSGLIQRHCGRVIGIAVVDGDHRPVDARALEQPGQLVELRHKRILTGGVVGRPRQQASLLAPHGENNCQSAGPGGGPDRRLGLGELDGQRLVDGLVRVRFVAVRLAPIRFDTGGQKAVGEAADPALVFW
jgi:hypothetical protein